MHIYSVDDQLLNEPQYNIITFLEFPVSARKTNNIRKLSCQSFLDIIGGIEYPYTNKTKKFHYLVLEYLICISILSQINFKPRNGFVLNDNKN